MNTQTEVAPIEVAKLVEDAIFWFEQRIDTLSDIAESKENIVIAKSIGDNLELTPEQSRAFKAGIATAIQIIGEFPLSVDRPTKQFEISDLEA
ncbi:hypothetical protein [Acinetobacter chinensis]|jgi:hypothetical protein|uniref:hypothetical protein n=1 Tax=Acinetobacter chinensis TaxID=2004650 RepID=UPI002934E35C|nr:hypothetical protein [Acinetobacter chinensis]WOE42917.1 hypothetical protein QSG87_07300 [Acinetobacter chinensis]